MRRIASFLVVAGVLASACGYTYRTLSQPPSPAQAVTTAPTVYFLPPSFAQVPRPESYQDDATWQTDLADILLEWKDQVPAYAADAGLGGRVAVLQEGQALPAGAVGVQMTVLGLLDDYNAFSGGFLYMTSNLRFIDSNGAVLFDSQVETTSKMYGPISWRSMAINGRIAFCSWALITVAFNVMHYGTIEPAEY